MTVKDILTNVKNPKNRKTLNRTVRWICQIIFFIFFPSAFTSAFSGIKYIFTQFGLRQAVEVSAFITVLISLCVYTIIFGRFFCGYACPFGTLGDFIREVYIFICKKRKKKAVSINPKISKYLSFIKYIVLFVIVLLCFLGVYGNISGWSPWDVFSMITSGNIHFGKYILGVIILLAIMVGMVFADRFFCRFLCPMGAVFAILPIVPGALLKRDRENCPQKCGACKKRCPAHLDIDGDTPLSGECICCHACQGICPKRNIRIGIPKAKDESLF